MGIDKKDAIVAFVQDRGGRISLKEKVSSVLSLLGGISRFVKTGDKVLLKPNFVAPFAKAVTNFEIIESIIEEVRRCQAEPIIAESSGYEFDTEMTFRALGVYEFAKRLNVEAVNLDTQPYRKVLVKGGRIKNYLVSEIVFDVDAIINLPRLKKHSQTDVTLGIKNLFGLLSRQTRRRVHALGLNEGIVQLCKIIQPSLTIVDASTVLERAVFGAEKSLGSIIAGQDILAVDRFCCSLIGIDPDAIGHIKIASEKNIGSTDFDIVGDAAKVAVALQKPDNNFKTKVHRFVYKLMYSLEMMLNCLFKENSLIPYFHYYLGLRPVINKKKCDQCRECMKVCSINAIDVEKKIIKKECRHLRCLRCVESCSRQAIELKGLRKSGI